MARRYRGKMWGEQYLANTSPSKMEVHDLDNEKTGPSECQIDEIIDAGHDQPFTTLSAVPRAFDHCDHCLKGSKR